MLSGFSLEEKKKCRVNNCLPLQTPQSIYCNMKVGALSGWFEERQREGSRLCSWCGFLSACLIAALPGSSSSLRLLACRPEPRQKPQISLAVKKKGCNSISLPLRVLLFTADFPIKTDKENKSGTKYSINLAEDVPKSMLDIIIRRRKYKSFSCFVWSINTSYFQWNLFSLFLLITWWNKLQPGRLRQVLKEKQI